MTDMISGSFDKIFGQLPQLFLYGFGSILGVLTIFFGVKLLLRLRGNLAFTSFNYGVIAPVQYGDRGSDEGKDQKFSKRLKDMVETEESYDLEKLMPKARELGAIAKSSFHTAPILADSHLAVLSLIESCVKEVDAGFRVLMHTRLESLVDMDSKDTASTLMQRSIRGIDLTFAVVDHFGRIVMAVEHEDGDKKTHQSVLNRAVVMEVLRKAGVWYLEIPQNFSSEDACKQILHVLQSHIQQQNVA